MQTQIKPYEPHHRDAVVRLSLQAWAPVFESLQQVLAPEVYAVFFPRMGVWGRLRRSHTPTAGML